LSNNHTYKWGLGIGDWGLGTQSPIPNPQSPIPNPQSPIPKKFKNEIIKNELLLLKNIKNINNIIKNEFRKH
jgi:hypothetical protein